MITALTHWPDGCSYVFWRIHMKHYENFRVRQDMGSIVLPLGCISLKDMYLNEFYNLYKHNIELENFEVKLASKCWSYDEAQYLILVPKANSEDEIIAVPYGRFIRID